MEVICVFWLVGFELFSPWNVKPQSGSGYRASFVDTVDTVQWIQWIRCVFCAGIDCVLYIVPLVPPHTIDGDTKDPKYLLLWKTIQIHL